MCAQLSNMLEISIIWRAYSIACRKVFKRFIRKPCGGGIRKRPNPWAQASIHYKRRKACNSVENRYFHRRSGYAKRNRIPFMKRISIRKSSIMRFFKLAIGVDEIFTWTKWRNTVRHWIRWATSEALGFLSQKIFLRLRDNLSRYDRQHKGINSIDQVTAISAIYDRAEALNCILRIIISIIFYC